MSSMLEEVEQTSKKRKHEGDSTKTRKKRKKLGTTAGPDSDDLALRSDKKEKKKKKKEEKVVEAEREAMNGESKPSIVSEISGLSEKEKKRKSKLAGSQIPRAKSTTEDEEQKAVTELAQNDDILDKTTLVDKVSVVDPTEHEVLRNGTLDASNTAQLQSDAPTSFYSIRMSLYLPIPPVASGGTGAVSAMLTMHLSPLILTYFPPAEGVILSFHDPMLSARPQTGLSMPLLAPIDGRSPARLPAEALSKMGDEFGASWAWLTITFLVFKPAPPEELQGWMNAMSEGFIGLVSYNYFQTSIPKSRIPKTWSWSGPSRQLHKQRKTPRKGRLNDGGGSSQESHLESQETVVARDDDATEGTSGFFVDKNGKKVPEDLNFRVIDLEMIPGSEKGQKFALQLDGTLLNSEEERLVREEEREKWENRRNKSKSRSKISGTPMMSGGLPSHSRAGSIISTP